MDKLVQRFKVDPTFANATKVANHLRKHPFAFMMTGDQATLNLALEVARGETFVIDELA